MRRLKEIMFKKIMYKKIVSPGADFRITCENKYI